MSRAPVSQRDSSMIETAENERGFVKKWMWIKSCAANNVEVVGMLTSYFCQRGDVLKFERDILREPIQALIPWYLELWRLVTWYVYRHLPAVQ
jgi:hypothetical protein